jgi:hypothetical protein
MTEAALDLTAMKLTPKQLAEVEEQAKALRALAELPEELKEARQLFIDTCEQHARTPEDVLRLRPKKKTGRGRKSKNGAARDEQ